MFLSGNAGDKRGWVPAGSVTPPENGMKGTWRAEGGHAEVTHVSSVYVSDICAHVLPQCLRVWDLWHSSALQRAVTPKV